MRIGLLLSGGIDSCVSAYLLQQEGHEVLGITMHNWEPAVLEKAAQAAQWLGIEHHIVDLRDEFYRHVIEYFVDTYAQGETPNPCVRCNETVKFGALLEATLALGCDKVASGHYARVSFNEKRGLYELYRGVDRRKDQSYFLCRLKQEQLRHLVFPLGEWKKSRVQEKAIELEMPTAHARESQETCFISGDYRDFLSSRLKTLPGEIALLDGKILGQHKGVPFYTKGQRRGLGISSTQPIYVVGLDAVSNRVLMGSNQDLMSTEAYAHSSSFLEPLDLSESHIFSVQVRYRSVAVPAQVRMRSDGDLHIKFKEAQRAVTAGQAVVFYEGERLLGGAVLKENFGDK